MSQREREATRRRGTAEPPNTNALGSDRVEGQRTRPPGRRGTFRQVPDSLWQRSDVQHGVTRLYCAMAYSANRAGHVWVRRKKYAKALDVHVNTVDRWMADLKRIGEAEFVKRHKRDDDGDSVNEYRLPFLVRVTPVTVHGEGGFTTDAEGALTVDGEPITRGITEREPLSLEREKEASSFADANAVAVTDDDEDDFWG